MAIAWFAGLIRPRSEAEARRSQPRNEDVKPQQKEGVEQEVDDIQIEVDNADEEEISVAFSEQEPTPVNDVTSTIEIIESEEPAVDENPSASGRLASMRDELGENDIEEREGSIEDRMNQFFGR
jgi:hypothetical protein